ncbi:MAG: hypothetical protein E7Z89_00500 [Cyanobacteria bacterium SIG28]|nr:hypothetical protein [Cyanobacteria bacterium SIG28]
MNLLLIKQLAIISAIAGVIIGLITVIPYVSLVSFLILLTCVSVFVLVYLKQNDLIGIISIKEGCIFGAIIGFVSFLTFSIIYAPISSILGTLISAYPQKHFIYFVTDFGTFVITVFILLFMAGLSALFNGFSGLVTAYLYEIFTGIKKETDENNSIDFTVE